MGGAISENRMFPQSELIALLRYEPETGNLFWMQRDVSRFTNVSYAQSWNTRYAGNRAFTSLMGSGYAQGSINGVRLMAHRVVWALVHGEWPTAIDHINGCRADNRLENLRAVTTQENQKNQARSKSNVSGVSGVHWAAKRQRWIAQIKVTRQVIFLGRFHTKAEAVAARKHAEITYGFHRNHGLSASERLAAEASLQTAANSKGEVIA